MFIAGRNRLEKEGAKVYAKFFKAVGTLEEVAMPQNGIFHEGIAALADAFSTNNNLRVVNLNDKSVQLLYICFESIIEVIMCSCVSFIYNLMVILAAPLPPRVPRQWQINCQ